MPAASAGAPAAALADAITGGATLLRAGSTSLARAAGISAAL
jgi:hypothetical protein